MIVRVATPQNRSDLSPQENDTELWRAPSQVQHRHTQRPSRLRLDLDRHGWRWPRQLAAIRPPQPRLDNGPSPPVTGVKNYWMSRQPRSFRSQIPNVWLT